MRPKKYILLLLLFSCSLVQAQSSILLRNNSWQDIEIRVNQWGSHTLDSTEWTLHNTRQVPWQNDQLLFELDRDSAAIPNGDSVFVDVELIANADTVLLRFRLDGDSIGSSLQYSASFSGQADNWYSNGGFHTMQGVFAGKGATLKYRPENGDGNHSRDVLFVLHETPVYSVNPADLNNPNTINVISYNLHMLPLFIGGTDNGLRAPLIPQYMDPGLDVVVFEEAFDPLPRIQGLIPQMEAQGFIYNSGILNDFLPFNGGVIIFSRWPIVATDEMDFLLCGPNSGDCFANKGIKYAKVNKLGKAYHIFGTHMDAGNATADLTAKNYQFKEMRDFIAAQNIPPNEPAIYGGDFNVGPLSSSNLYPNMLDSLNPMIPDYIGFFSSTMSLDTGKIIDHCWVDRRSMLPVSATNEIITIRGIEDDMWDISDFSDHRTCWGRFVFPDIEYSDFDTVLCTGENVTLEVQASGVVHTYQWERYGVAIPGATSSVLNLSNIDSTDAGPYACRVQYLTLLGNLNDDVNQLFFPNGPETATSDLLLEGWTVDVECPVNAASEVFGNISVSPIPAHNLLQVTLEHLPPKGLIQIHDLSGREMLEIPIRQLEMSINVEELPAGIYVLSLSHKDGKWLKKIVLN